MTTLDIISQMPFVWDRDSLADKLQGPPFRISHVTIAGIKGTCLHAQLSTWGPNSAPLGKQVLYWLSRVPSFYCPLIEYL